MKRLYWFSIVVGLSACGSGTTTVAVNDTAVGPADTSPCTADQFWYRDKACGPVSNPGDAGGDAGLTMGCSDMGDGKCYRLCKSDTDCTEPGWTHCGELGLFDGNDVCSTTVKICKPTAKSVCGKVQ